MILPWATAALRQTYLILGPFLCGVESASSLAPPGEAATTTPLPPLVKTLDTRPASRGGGRTWGLKKERQIKLRMIKKEAEIGRDQPSTTRCVKSRPSDEKTVLKTFEIYLKTLWQTERRQASQASNSSPPWLHPSLTPPPLLRPQAPWRRHSKDEPRLREVW